MRKTIDRLLSEGHSFPGLDENGDKFRQVGSGINAPKVCIFLGNPDGCDILAILDNGRNFLKRECPGLVDETDEEWCEQLAAARNKATA